MPDAKATDRKFITNFDGDEINGKRYGLGAPVTGLDAATALYLTERTGRISEITDEHFAELTAENPEGEDLSGGESGPGTTEATFDPDLLDPEAAAKSGDDRFVSKDQLKKLAEAGGVTIKSSATKTEIATAIMASRQVVS